MEVTVVEVAEVVQMAVALQGEAEAAVEEEEGVGLAVTKVDREEAAGHK